MGFSVWSRIGLESKDGTRDISKEVIISKEETRCSASSEELSKGRAVKIS